ncbi:endonuclease IV [Entomoplasma freundtii]|uniref:Probable endonuclease 4 n=1 Tax=Entomoplasma freundtii TaxID=74700 RepID=A0A2K8NRQ3_9MOLU|nr:deoxyribonuclease IV [Entomoplasma freundtii]ATZ16457.1 endonuclease IV [Entomoplasma freundtii]TDY55987.1 endonuclease IV [Entomoplasma freundtii]
MNSNYPLLGGHVSVNGPSGYLVGAIKTALNQGCNTIMFFTGAPQNTKRVDPFWLRSNEMRQIMVENKIDSQHIVVHASYLINVANSVDSYRWEFSLKLLAEEIERCEVLGVNLIVLHPGSTVGASHQASLDKLIEALDILMVRPSPVKIALETMSGKGGQICSNLEDFAYIFKNLKKPERIGVCLDTCHLHDAGYDLSDWKAFKKELFNFIPPSKVWAFHLNDSASPLGSHHDRHENIGYGLIGFETLSTILWDETFQTIPKLLETPLYNGQSTHQWEITNLRNRNFKPFHFEDKKNKP